MEFKWLSWDDTVKLCENLSKKVKEYNPDILVGVSRGGLVPLRLLSDITGIKKVGVLGIEFYKKIGETREKPEITHDLPVDITNKKVLIIDDVADSGKSLIVAKDYIIAKGAKEAKTATLHYKPVSKLKPDFFVDITSDWIVYPWEINEVKREMEEIKKKMN